MKEPDFKKILDGLIGKRCCRQRAGRGRSLSVGFGDRVYHSKSNVLDNFYGEWEIGTYSAAWRVTFEDRIICGSLNIVDSIGELDEQLQSIELGAIVAINTSKLDIKIELDNNTYIDIMCASVDVDEFFHVFSPNNIYLEYRWPEGWRAGASHIPWKN